MTVNVSSDGFLQLCFVAFIFLPLMYFVINPLALPHASDCVTSAKFQKREEM